MIFDFFVPSSPLYILHLPKTLIPYHLNSLLFPLFPSFLPSDGSRFFPRTAFSSQGFPVRSSPPERPDASRPSPSSFPKLLFLLMAFTPTYLRFLSLPVLFCPAGSSCWHLQSLPLPVGRCRTLWLFSDLSIACAHPRQNVLF